MTVIQLRLLQLALTQYYMTENEDGARPARPAMPMDEDEDDDDSDEDFVPSAEPDEDELPRRSSRKKKEKPTSSSKYIFISFFAYNRFYANISLLFPVSSL